MELVKRKLTDEQVKELRRLYWDEEVGYTKLSYCFNIHRSTVKAIIRGDTYKVRRPI